MGSDGFRPILFDAARTFASWRSFFNGAAMSGLAEEKTYELPR
jgi:uncharacterized membrane protein YoaK (UPF0700 family)